MARLEAVGAGLYYPTPEPVITALAQYLRLPTAAHSSLSTVSSVSSPRPATLLPGSGAPDLAPHRAPTIRLLDPCAGKGRALALLAHLLQTPAQQCTPSVAPNEHSVRAVAFSDTPTTDVARATECAVPTLELYGIEPNTERALEAQGRIPNLLATSFFTATLSEGGFQLAFVNPPYDLEAETDTASAPRDSGNGRGNSGVTGKRERLELRFLRRTTNKLAPDGVLVWIVPQRLLRDGAKHLAERYRDLACWRFPDTPWRPPDAREDQPATPMYAAFRQVVVLGIRRRTPLPADAETLERIERWADLGEALEPLPSDLPTASATLTTGASPELPQSPAQGASPTVPEHDRAPAPEREPGHYVLPVAMTPLRSFLAATFDPDAVAAQVARPGIGVWGERGYCERHWPDVDTLDVGIGQPLAPLRRGHLALLAAAGIANGQELVGTDGRRLVVKGACRKVCVREESEERDATSGERVQIVTETERFEVALWAIDLETGETLHIL
ncbi:MAG TPA: DUF6094 domain-containing protein [Ktedonobacterales bacterium]|nr:DUF6094 domain-containing protein [Ktedonobacterales bacterium]